MDLLNGLKKFYRTESQGLPHYEDDLIELAYALADFIESQSYEEDGEIWFDDENLAKDEEKLAEQMMELRRNPSATLIDTTINHMHQGLLDAIDRSGGMSEDMMSDYEGDIAEYLLSRE